MTMLRHLLIALRGNDVFPLRRSAHENRPSVGRHRWLAWVSLGLAFVLSASVLAVTAFAAPVPVSGDAPVPVDRIRLGNPTILAMTGTWRFKLEQGISPAVNGELPADAAVPAFASPDASDADWKNIPVPANWEIEGFSPLTYQDRATNQANQSKDIGLYRRLADIPASFAGQRVLWHFDGSFDGTEVFVNGQRCGYHESGFTAFNIDVTKALKPGLAGWSRRSGAKADRCLFSCFGFPSGWSPSRFILQIP